MKVLSAEMITHFPTWASIVLVSMIGVVLIVAIFLSFKSDKWCADTIGLAFCITLLFAFLVSMVVIVIGGKFPTETGRYRYKVTFEDAKPDLEALGRDYKIENDEGLIWILEEREVKE